MTPKQAAQGETPDQTNDNIASGDPGKVAQEVASGVPPGGVVPSSLNRVLTRMFSRVAVSLVSLVRRPWWKIGAYLGLYRRGTCWARMCLD